jgi:alkylation response protein AidB-like acyl-CoA dehydrogenase
MPDDPIDEAAAECRKFLKHEIHDKVLDADLQKTTDWVFHIWEKSRHLDLPLILLPEKYHGAGFSPCSCAVLLDIIAAECAGIASVFAFHYAGCMALLNADIRQQSIVFPLLTGAGNHRPAVVAPVFPSETEGHRIEVEENDHGLVIHGTTALTGNALIADIFCVFIEDNDDTGEHITCAVLEKSSPGLSIGHPANLPGLKVNGFAPIIFDHVRVDHQWIVGTRKKARAVMKKAKDGLFRFIAAMAMGAARTAFEKASAYARHRYQSGKIIIHHQEIQRMLGAMKMKLSMGTAGYLNSFDENTVFSRFETPKPSLVKVFCTDTALEIAMDAIQIHGGYGYLHEYGLEKIMRDLKVLQLMLGRNPKCLINAISEEIQHDR